LRQAPYILLLSLPLATGCKSKETADRASLEAPPSQSADVTSAANGTLHVSDPKPFSFATAAIQQTTATLNVTGSVAPDVSREIPVLSIANGRVVALHAGLGDVVHKGQLVMEVQSPDVATAFAAYLKAVADEHLTQVVLTRDKLLFDKGAIAQSQLEIAQNGEDDAVAALKASEQQLAILGVDRNHPGDTVKVYAPASGVIIAQNTTAAGAAGITFAGANGSFTIADLSHVWVICDVYENDLAQVHLRENVQIRLNAFPDKVRTGTISDIGAVLDPSIRTAKVRIQVPNPDRLLRVGMFATATFLGAHPESVVTVPGTAVLHLHDSEFVFEPAGSPGDFRQVRVKLGRTLDGNTVEILAGLSPGQQIVANALELQNTAAQ
jgi:cobalt-zinc-cadmium efflux system membrane fusion protein